MGDDSTVALEALRVDEGKLRGHVNEVVRSSVDATLTMRKRTRFVRRSGISVRRIESRAGHCELKLKTQAGEVTKPVPKLRSPPFETAILERFRLGPEAAEEARGGERATELT